MNLPGFPVYRPRRLRQSPALRQLVAETRLSAGQLVLPLFVRSGRKLRHPIAAMPGVFQLSPDEIVREAARAHTCGIPAVLLFGIPDEKDVKASGAYAKNGIVQQTVRLLKKEVPSLLVITDVCLCEYMEHGHCGVVRQGKILNDPSLALLARTAASHAEAGSDIVAPSDNIRTRFAMAGGGARKQRERRVVKKSFPSRTTPQWPCSMYSHRQTSVMTSSDGTYLQQPDSLLDDGIFLRKHRKLTRLFVGNAKKQNRRMPQVWARAASRTISSGES